MSKHSRPISSPNSTKHDVAEYIISRQEELARLKLAHLVSANAVLSYEIFGLRGDVSVYKTGSLFYTDITKKMAVAVLFMNARQELELVEECDAHVGLAPQILGSSETIKKNYKKFGIFDAPQNRPTVAKVQNAFECAGSMVTKLVIQDYITKQESTLKRKEALVRVETELERFKQRKKNKNSRMNAKILTPVEPLVCVQTTNHLENVEVIESLQCVASSTEMECARNKFVVTQDPPKINSLKMHVTPQSAIGQYISGGKSGRWNSFPIGLKQLTVFRFPAHSSRNVHLDISTHGKHDPPKLIDVKYPYAHFSLEEWCQQRANPKEAQQTYGSIIKGDFIEKLDRAINIKTLKQIREEDRRHIERLKRARVWEQTLALFTDEK